MLPECRIPRRRRTSRITSQARHRRKRDLVIAKAAAFPISLVAAYINPLTTVPIAWGAALEDIARHYPRRHTTAVAVKRATRRAVSGARFVERRLGIETRQGHVSYSFVRI